MSFSVFKTLGEGFNLIRKNPTIVVPIIIASLASSIVQSLDLILLTLLSSILSILLGGVVIKMSYSAIRNEKISFDKSLRAVLDKAVPLIVASILFFLMMIVGFILFLVPGIFLGIKFAFFQLEILLSNAGIVESLKRSWRDTNGIWWKLFGFYALMALLVGLVYTPLFVISIINHVKSISLTSSIISGFVISLIASWFTVSLTIAYTKLRK